MEPRTRPPVAVADAFCRGVASGSKVYFKGLSILLPCTAATDLHVPELFHYLLPSHCSPNSAPSPLSLRFPDSQKQQGSTRRQHYWWSSNAICLITAFRDEAPAAGSDPKATWSCIPVARWNRVLQDLLLELLLELLLICEDEMTIT